jgi:DNA-binding HxlR family transcriptional regulator
MDQPALTQWHGMRNAVHQIGDSWTLLIVWEALQGTSRFNDFHSRLGIGRTILSSRLSRLVDEGILVRRPVQPGTRYLEYRITRKGEALRPALELLEGWGRRRRTDGAPPRGLGPGMFNGRRRKPSDARSPADLRNREATDR